MTHDEFQKLSLQDQETVINKYGVFVRERIVAGSRIYLVLINYFYVELFHELSNLKNKRIIICNIYEDASRLPDEGIREKEYRLFI